MLALLLKSMNLPGKIVANSGLPFCQVDVGELSAHLHRLQSGDHQVRHVQPVVDRRWQRQKHLKQKCQINFETTVFKI